MRPKASWGGVEFYPSFAMKAAVLLVRLTKNHALPDGNKRTALAPAGRRRPGW
jgi:death on curing protein